MATQVLRNTFPVTSKAAARKPATRSLWWRVFDFIVEAQTRRAEREIERLMSAGGLKFTDAAEREYEQRYLSSSSKL